MALQICIITSQVQNLVYMYIGFLVCLSTTIALCVYVFTCSSQRSNERLPGIVWCREPFFEELNYIEALNDINN